MQSAKLSLTRFAVVLQWLRLSTEDVVQVKPFRPPMQNFAASLLVAEIGRVQKKIITSLDLEATDLTQQLTSRMNGMVCCKPPTRPSWRAATLQSQLCTLLSVHNSCRCSHRQDSHTVSHPASWCMSAARAEVTSTQ